MNLPFVLSVPHCGDEIPPDLRPDIALSDREILESVDFGTREIFAPIRARTVIVAQWSRLVGDLNRDPARLDEKGVVALTDYHGRRVFVPGREPDPETIARRVDTYHRPYHDRIVQALDSPDVLGLIDCHSLNGTGPADAPDPGAKRKDVTLSNNGDALGRPRSDGGPTSCSEEMVSRFAEAFGAEGFSVSVNAPYHGGYITQHHGGRLYTQGRFGIQIEMSQDCYMSAGDVTPDPDAVRETAAQVLSALSRVATGLGLSAS